MATNEPLVSPHVDAAKALLDKVRALRAEIPRFVPVTPGESRKLATKTAVPDAFLESASVAIQVSERLANAAGTDAATLRDSFGFALAYASLVQEFLALGRATAHTLRVERAAAASSALDIYAIARRLSKQKTAPSSCRMWTTCGGRSITPVRGRRTRTPLPRQR